MTVHYEFKLERQARSLFQVKGLAGLTVKSKATELNSKAGPRSLKSCRLPCQVVHTVDRILHCTVHTGHLNYNLLGPSQQALDLPHLLLRKQKKIPRLAFPCYRHLNSRKPHTTPQLCERTTFTKIINKNNEIAINTKEQIAVHHSNRPVALAFMNI